jgi:hypothetical protein
MSKPTHTNPRLAPDNVAAAIADIAEGKTTTAAARDLGVARTSLIAAIERYERVAAEEFEPGVVEHEDGGITVTGDPMVGNVRLTPTELLRKCGIDIDEVIIVRQRTNAWGSVDSPNFQLRVDTIPKNMLVQLDPDREWLPAPKPVKRAEGEPFRWAWMGDHHFPYVDWGLLQTGHAFLEDFQPHLVVIGGDLLNNGQWARHRSRPRFVEEANEGIRGAGGELRKIRDILPNSQIVWLPGNHDQWIEQRLIEDQSAALNTRGYSDQYDALDIRRLLDIDPIHVEYVDKDWDLAYFPITDKFVATHGTATGKNAADQMFAKLTGSSIHGHSHRGKMTFKTRHNPATDETDCNVAIEAMMMARHHEGMGYANQPDWMQGFFYGSAWEDNTFAAAPAVYVDAPGKLLLADGRRYDASVDKFGEPLA